MRRSILSLVCVLLPLPAGAADAAKGQSKFAGEFGKHWSTAKTLTLAVADAMPAENYDFRPNSEEMTFGQQIAHIAQANFGYCSRLNNSKAPPAARPEMLDKAAVMKLAGDSFDYCSAIITGLTEQTLGEMRGPEGRQSSVREVMLAVLGHMAHHRGQAEVYLRAKGIKPPTYTF